MTRDSTAARQLLADRRQLIHRLGPVLLALAIAMLITAWMGWQAAAKMDGLNHLADQRAAVHRNRLAVEQLLSLMKDIETGQRGFVITGNEAFLDPYVAAIDRLPEARRTVSIGLLNEPDALRHWPAIQGSIDLRMQLAARAVEARRALGTQALSMSYLFETGKVQMDTLRRLTGELDAVLVADLTRISGVMSGMRASWRLDLLFAAALIALLGLLSMVLILRDRWLRLRAEQASDEARATLESRVQERTAELSAAHARIASFAVEQERSIEAERRRIAREVHDQLGQVFTAIRLVLGSAPAGSLPASQAAAVQQALEQGISTSRRIAADLRPPCSTTWGWRQRFSTMASSSHGQADRSSRSTAVRRRA